MNRIRSVIRNAFAQARGGVGVGRVAYTSVGVLVFHAVSTILDAVEEMVIGILDVVDGLITGTYRAVVPKEEP